MKQEYELNLITEPAIEVLEGLKEISLKLDLVLNNVYQWKWVILATNNTIQNAMTNSIRDSAGVNILREKIRTQMVDSMRNDAVQRPIERLDEFFNLYEGTKGFEMKKVNDNRAYIPKGNEERSIRDIHIIRNNFLHFIPKLWGLYIADMPDIIIDCMKYIRFLTIENFNFFTLPKAKQIREYKSNLYKIRVRCNKIKNEYKKIIKEERNLKKL